ncbi:MAG: SRPBCC domain-containing protein [Ignavibacteriales bacterium]|nr:SRPBCC domain-containing protein [Ignavibacteriales bacterium]
MKHDWSRFVKRIPINAETKEIYKSWAAPHGLEKWFLRKAEFKDTNKKILGPNEIIQVGDTYEWYWHGWPDEVVERGTILEANGRDFLKFSFGKAGIVSVAIKNEEGENIVELTQEEIPTDEESKVNFHMGCSEGWAFYLVNLKSILEGGIDLRNKDLRLKRVVNS